MRTTTLLEWWHNGQWHEIGWRADSGTRSAADLHAHGAKLASQGGWYRLVTPSIYLGGPPEVLHEFTPATSPAT